MTDVLYWIGWVLFAYTYVMIVRMVMGLVLAYSQYRPSGTAAVAFEFVYSMTDPPLKFLGRFIPPLRIGNFALDLSFIVLLIGLRIIAAQLMSA
ncbi:MAG TPA: YggT family protein [Frankiaceae bacterium]|nr:YggT family protein [Frankiaceae bacterium]